MELHLVTPQDKEAVLSYKEEFILNGDSMDGTSMLKDADSFESWYEDLQRNSSEETVAEGWVPATLFLAKVDGKLVGMIDIRHRFNDFLAEYGGHIGYSVRKSERRKGYATQMLALALKECKKLGMEKVLITCLTHNVASAGVIVKNGGVFERETSDGEHTLKRFWIDLD